MVSKVAVPNTNAPDMSAFFNWGLKIRDIDELFIVTGRPAWTADGTVMYPNDGVAQTRFILDDIANYLAENDYAPNDLIRIEYTFTKDVDPNTYQEIYGLFAEFLADCEVKPAANTLRIVETIGLPGLCVEYEFWGAK
jgi:hypothetical protein